VLGSEWRAGDQLDSAWLLMTLGQPQPGLHVEATTIRNDRRWLVLDVGWCRARPSQAVWEGEGAGLRRGGTDLVAGLGLAPLVEPVEGRVVRHATDVWCWNWPGCW